MPRERGTDTRGLEPEKRKIVQVELDYWSHELAESFGFPELVPEMEPDVSFYVGVGFSEDGIIVRAKLLSKRPVNHNLERYQRDAKENQLLKKAKKVFGLKE